jgi:hypothetical protein
VSLEHRGFERVGRTRSRSCRRRPAPRWGNRARRSPSRSGGSRGSPRNRSRRLSPSTQGMVNQSRPTASPQPCTDRIWGVAAPQRTGSPAGTASGPVVVLQVVRRGPPRRGSGAAGVAEPSPSTVLGPQEHARSLAAAVRVGYWRTPTCAVFWVTDPSALATWMLRSSRCARMPAPTGGTRQPAAAGRLRRPRAVLVFPRLRAVTLNWGRAFRTIGPPSILRRRGFGSVRRGGGRAKVELARPDSPESAE